MTIRVLLADDHPLTRAGLAAYLRSQDGIELVGEAADGQEAWEKILQEEPDVALLDVRMPIMDGVTVARRLKQEKMGTVSLMLTSYDARQYVLASIRAGAKGYVLKTTTPDELGKAIAVVSEGGVYLDREVASAVGDGDFSPDNLSHREREVLDLAARGLSSKEVARKLFISERTVQTHLASIYDKLGARNKTEAMLLALRYGVVTLEELLE